MRAHCRWLCALVLTLGLTSSVSAQDRREVELNGACAELAGSLVQAVAAQDVECWSSSRAPCEGVGRVELVIRTGRRPVALRVIEVAVEVEGVWREAVDLHLSLGSAPVTRPPRAPIARVPRRASDRLSVFFTLIPAPALHSGAGVRTRVTIEIGGRRATLYALSSAVTESPDPEL